MFAKLDGVNTFSLRLWNKMWKFISEWSWVQHSAFHVHALAVTFNICNGLQKCKTHIFIKYLSCMVKHYHCNSQFKVIQRNGIEIDNNVFESSPALKLMFTYILNYKHLKIMCSKCYQLWGPHTFVLDGLRIFIRILLQPILVTHPNTCTFQWNERLTIELLREIK